MIDTTTVTGRPALKHVAAEFLQRKHQLLIGGKWTDARSGKMFDVTDPGTGEVITRVAEADAADVDAAVSAARHAFSGPWGNTKPAERTRLMWRLADLIDRYAEELAELESLDNGKPITSARNGDIPSAAAMLRYMAGWATKLDGHTIDLSLPSNWHAYTLREPVGVVAQIIPWNFPLSMATWKIAPALATGCTMILKPAEQTPLTALRLGELVEEAGFPPGVVNILTGFGETAGAALAAHMDVDKVAFTGSTEVGRLIVRAALGNLKRVSLELGGKSPVIVFPDADVDAAIRGSARAIFNNSGQVCAAGSRLYAHRRVFDRMVDGVSNEARKLQIGHGLRPETQLGPLVSAEQFQRVSKYVEQGMRDGATLVSGGHRIGESGNYFAPTVLTGTAPSMAIVQEEIFGPVLCIMPFENDDLEAIAATANDTKYGLAASIWTRDISVAHKLARRIRAGSIGINAHGVGDAAMPFGGYKESGWGRERGREVLDSYTEIKSVGVFLG